MAKKPYPTPVRPIRQIVDDSGNDAYVNRLLVATPTTGLVRIEWALARFGQITPVNWSAVQMLENMSGYYPLRYQVADAQNLIVKFLLEHDFEWLLLVEHDNILPPDAFIRFNQYMRDEITPVVSGLYYTRSRPSEPLVFRGRGTSVYDDFKVGDLVYCDGVPTGTLLIHHSVLRLMWDESPEYQIKKNGGVQVCRRVFDTPRHLFFDPENEYVNITTGTSDLDWCTRVMKDTILERSGWQGYLDRIPDKRYPFLVDTNIFVKHVNPDGEAFP